jgi:carboxymethylenebutenolidase
MAKTGKNDATENLNPTKEALRILWVKHARYEFSTGSTGDTLATMADDAYIKHLPVLVAGSGRDEFLPTGQ